jgi:hypothetical protein
VADRVDEMTLSGPGVPRRVEGYAVEQLDSEVLLYDPRRTAVVYLNSTALLVWQLCDGRRSSADIIHLLARAFHDSPQVSDDVAAALELLAGHGVVTFGPAGG